MQRKKWLTLKPVRNVAGSEGVRAEDAWLVARNSADADSWKGSSCEHLPELCKPTLITSFLPVKGYDPSDSPLGSHPCSFNPSSQKERFNRRKILRERNNKLPASIATPLRSSFYNRLFYFIRSFDTLVSNLDLLFWIVSPSVQLRLKESCSW